MTGLFGRSLFSIIPVVELKGRIETELAVRLYAALREA